ncbi:hypothetical protein SETIT_5G217000v2 [Setaria italica]|uniref:Leucine-rich repeat-containing N-terminal plant-type domain-containing protein n=1 Tax=Setaria italica TaxID=4555 RepID=A0A368R7H0_SETIT|nr:hypothetical protein SETIT_5G217000v2 [Setaria italica]
MSGSSVRLCWQWPCTDIVFLYQSGNHLGGVGIPIPSFLGSFRRLIYLNLSCMDFDGMVPPQLGNLSKLQYLDLDNTYYDYSGYDNVLQSEDLSWLPRLPFLRALHLRRCKLVFTYTPLVHRNLTSLKMVDLTSNMIANLNPAYWFWDADTIRHLDLSYNWVVGPLPDAVGNMTSLEVLHLGGNQLSDMKAKTLKNLCNMREFIDGGIPNWINQWTNLSIIQLSANRLVGSVPLEIGMLSKLSHLHLDYNQFNGSILEEHLAGLVNLKELDFPFKLKLAYFPGCKMGHQFPLWIQGQRDVSFLDISDAGIVDYLPEWYWSVFSNVEYLNISCNQISGRLPRSLDLCRTLPQLHKHLVELDISKNSLSGPLPRKIIAQNLTDLLLSDNCISGAIPSYICQLPFLSLPLCSKQSFISALILYDNLLSGKFPSVLQSCPDLILLDLADNKYIGDPINMFSGSIPVKLMELGYLQFLDLAYNRISGSIPHSLANLKAMTQDQVGKIPDEITYLVGLMGLNISHNQLSGEIPVKLGQLQSMESLDLSWNELSGEIPSSLSGMTMLSKLNLSYNNLSGRIPSGNQLQTLTDPASSYIGNNYLCGPPVSRNCSAPEVAGRHHDGHQSDSDVRYFYVGMAVGFVLGLWVVFVAFLFARTWRAAYFQMFDNLLCGLEISVAASFRRCLGKLY